MAWKPRIFRDDIDFMQTFFKYIEYCHENKRFANIAGFCVYADINRDTFYEYKKHYPTTFQKIYDALEDEVLNCKNVAMSIFYLKNKFGYSDRQQLDIALEVPKLESFFLRDKSKDDPIQMMRHENPKLLG